MCVFILWPTCGGQRPSCQSLFSPYSMWSSGIEFRLSALATNAFTFWVVFTCWALQYFGWSLQLLVFQYFNFQYMVWIHRCETDGYEEPTMLLIPWTQHGFAPTPHNSSVCLHTMSEAFTSGPSGKLKKMKFIFTALRSVVWQVDKTHPKL